MSKRDKKDIELSELLKKESFDATPNQWFTHRVLHKLPMKKNNSALHMAWFFYIAAALLCIGYWIWLFFFNDNTVITVRDILYFTIAGIVTLLLTFSPLVAMFSRE
ncbi:MAG: hypothetical protein IJK68_06555 [Muribaculaceae bacterium]|nr:hypothetical protein [Muribaculaceae bacterium]MBR0025349.1 hypothetical protein [Muribaculaceae bacterium]